MKETGVRNSAHGADKFGLKELAAVHWNLPDTVLVENAVAAGEGSLVQGGAFCAETGIHTGRSPKDKHTSSSMGRPRRPFGGTKTACRRKNSSCCFDDFIAHAKGKTLYAQDLYGGADPKYRIKARVYNELAWHSLFIRALLIRPERCRARGLRARHDHRRLPSFKADPKRHGVRSETIMAIDSPARSS